MCKCPAVARGGWAQLELTDALAVHLRKMQKAKKGDMPTVLNALLDA